MRAASRDERIDEKSERRKAIRIPLADRLNEAARRAIVITSLRVILILIRIDSSVTHSSHTQDRADEMAMRTRLHQLQDDQRGPTTADAPDRVRVAIPLPPPRAAAADHQPQSGRRHTQSEGGDASLRRSGTDTAHAADPDAAAASPAASPPHSNRDPRTAQSQSRLPVAGGAAQRDHHPTIRAIEHGLSASTGGAATATAREAASASRSAAAAALSSAAPLDRRPSVSVVPALSSSNQRPVTSGAMLVAHVADSAHHAALEAEQKEEPWAVRSLARASIAAAPSPPLATADDIRIGSILVGSNDRLCDVVGIQTDKVSGTRGSAARAGLTQSTATLQIGASRPSCRCVRIRSADRIQG